MPQHHDKNHHHHHEVQPQSSSKTLSPEEKLAKLLDHWVRHNEDHAQTYRDWGGQAKEIKLEKVAQLLEEAAQMTEQISERFIDAAAILKTQP